LIPARSRVTMSVMAKWKVALGSTVVFLAVGIGACRILRGPSGATTDYGGSIEARAIPEFPSAETSRWVNGAPTPMASLRGQVVFIEAWSPS
jgi:hypothetical protein